MIPKAERDADAAILAAATGGTWITLMVLDTANNKLGMAGRVLSNIGAASANGVP